jgi:hypothetical protein
MVFKLEGCCKHEEITEMVDALSNFEQNYKLNHKKISYIMEKNPSEIAPYFVIYPESDAAKIRDVSPIKNSYSHTGNFLVNNDKEMLILLDGTYFRILKNKPIN